MDKKQLAELGINATISNLIDDIVDKGNLDETKAKIVLGCILNEEDIQKKILDRLDGAIKEYLGK